MNQVPLKDINKIRKLLKELDIKHFFNKIIKTPKFCLQSKISKESNPGEPVNQFNFMSLKQLFAFVDNLVTT